MLTRISPTRRAHDHRNEANAVVQQGIAEGETGSPTPRVDADHESRRPKQVIINAANMERLERPVTSESLPQ